MGRRAMTTKIFSKTMQAFGLMVACAAPALAQVPYDTTANLAYSGNGFAKPGVSAD
jgi:hypothetical protein